MAVTLASRLAVGAPVPVFAAVGPGMSDAVDDLSTWHRIGLQPTVRSAAILLVAGRPRATDAPALRRLHDQMPHPRATVWWRSVPQWTLAGAAAAPTAEQDPVALLIETHRALIAGERESEPDLLPDEPPNQWRGVGPHGQGGEGMMGGVPYGRPMPMMGAEIRDGLMLDAYTARFGPFLPVLPPGLSLELTLQGDVIQSAAVRRPPYGDPLSAAGRLRAAARLLGLLGLGAHAQRLRRLAHDDEGLRRSSMFAQMIRLSGAFRAIPPGLGSLPAAALSNAPLCDAAGGIDVRARLRRWLFAPDAPPAGGAPGPSADSSPSADSGLRLVDLLPGLEWTEAMLVVNSFEPPLLEHLCPVDPEEEDEGEDGGEDGGEDEGDGHERHGSEGCQ